MILNGMFIDGDFDFDLDYGWKDEDYYHARLEELVFFCESRKWLTRDKGYMELKDMDDDHVYNILKGFKEGRYYGGFNLSIWWKRAVEILSTEVYIREHTWE